MSCLMMNNIFFGVHGSEDTAAALIRVALGARQENTGEEDKSLSLKKLK